MAFATSLHDQRLDEMRFGNGQQHDLSTFPAYTPHRSSTDFSSHSAVPDARIGLQRRFTTDSMMASGVWDSMRLQRAPGAADPLDLARLRRDGADVNKNRQRMQLIQQKQIECNNRRQEQQKYGAQMQLMELQNRRDEAEILRMAQNMDRMALQTKSYDRAPMPSNRSEPTTPPDFRDGSFGRPKPVLPVASALATPPGVGNRPEQQLITPPAEEPVLSILSPSHGNSVPQSRRNSDENKSSIQAPIGGHRSARNSLSSNVIDRPQIQNGPSRFALGQVSTADYLFEDDENLKGIQKNQTKSPDANNSYLRMMDTEENFPILTSSRPGKLSASSAALDLALSPNSSEQEKHQNPWGSGFIRSHRPAQHSLPAINYPITPSSNSSPRFVPPTESPAMRRFERSQTDFPVVPYTESLNGKLSQTEVTHGQQSTMPKLQASYSTSDLPTLSNPPGGTTAQSTVFGRGPLERHRHSRVPSLSSGDRTLSGAPISFGPPLSASMSSMPVISPAGMSPLPSPGVYGSYGHINIPNPVFQAMPFGAYPIYGQNKVQDVTHPHHNSQVRNVQKRNHDSGEANRFTNSKLEDLVDQIYSLCKDQHGCRYLQKKLEEGNPQYVEMIYRETHAHVVELMTDPFGNYLCQKLLEFANNEQRTVLVNTAAPNLVDIALNQHGTRALQKMIEFLSTPEQISTIIRALENKVVDLIQDLNGNHVIQKCLNRLKPDDAQFIFDAVGAHCIAVGTHRHGCCVLQRCIDHASGKQKLQLIQRITQNSLSLVQDAFGNYVVQYILDLNEPQLSEPVIRQFCGRVCELAKQKFSSNVIEKCIRVAEPPTKKLMIDEMIDSGQLDSLLRDCYANYVIQTSIDYSDQSTKQRLVESVGPLLPSIRNFPYGRRISGKLAALENKAVAFQNGGSSGPAQSHSRSNSYTNTQVRPISVHGQSAIRPTPVHHHSYTTPFRTEMATPFLM